MQSCPFCFLPWNFIPFDTWPGIIHVVPFDGPASALLELVVIEVVAAGSDCFALKPSDAVRMEYRYLSSRTVAFRLLENHIVAAALLVQAFLLHQNVRDTRLWRKHCESAARFRGQAPRMALPVVLCKLNDILLNKKSEIRTCRAEDTPIHCRHYTT